MTRIRFPRSASALRALSPGIRGTLGVRRTPYRPRYGSEAPIFHPQWALEAFWDFQIPQDLIEGYGYPQLTEQAKRKSLGENLLRLHGMDPEETRARLARR